jgi:hypothetical protein
MNLLGKYMKLRLRPKYLGDETAEEEKIGPSCRCLIFTRFSEITLSKRKVDIRCRVPEVRVAASCCGATAEVDSEINLDIWKQIQ